MRRSLLEVGGLHRKLLLLRRRLGVCRVPITLHIELGQVLDRHSAPVEVRLHGSSRHRVRHHTSSVSAEFWNKPDVIGQAVMADWRPSPMWKCDRALTTMEQLPDIQPNESSHTRREKRIAFVMPEDVLQLLNKSK